jgi:tRNA (Guanine-1)-methyltransferase
VFLFFFLLKEANNCARQLTYVFAQNREHVEPFNINFCNANLSERAMQKLKRNIPTMLDLDFPMNVTEKHYLDLFPKERLVYLTPHCRQDLVEYSHDDIYIIGKKPTIIFLFIYILLLFSILPYLRERMNLNIFMTSLHYSFFLPKLSSCVHCVLSSSPLSIPFLFFL